MATEVLNRPISAAPAAQAPQARWLDLPQQPFDLNGPAGHPYRPFERSWIERPIFDAFLAVAARAPDRIAVADGTRQLTFRELREAACRMARVLAEAVPEGVPVGILLPNDALYPVAVLGALAAGRVCVLLDTNYPAARNAAIVADAAVGAVVAAEPDEQAAAGVRVVPIGAAWDAACEPTPPMAPGMTPGDPAFIVYTSGSTGRPKGIALAQRTFTHRSGQLIEALHLNDDDRMMPLGSPCTVAGLLQMVEALLVGATLIKIDLQRAGLGVVLDTVERMRATTLLGTPALLRNLCRLPDAARKMSSLRCVHAAGDVLLKVDVETLRRDLPPSCLLLVTYGATEAPAMGHWFVTADAAGVGARVASGYPLPDYRYALNDEDGAPAMPGEPGELVVSSRYTAVGEWQNGRLVAGRLTPDPADPDAHILRTGDLVQLRSDGLITVLGRQDRLVKINGMRVEPYEIECVLRRSPDVADATVLVRRNGQGAALVGFVVCNAPADGTALERLRGELRAALPAYMQPARLHAIERLPLLPGHKIDTDALAALDDSEQAEKSAAAAPPAAAGAAAEQVAAAWEQLLDRASFDADTAFDAAGGDSLALLMLVSDLEGRCRKQLPLLRFALAMRPSEMIAAIAEIAAGPADGDRGAMDGRGRSPALVLLKPGRNGAPLFLMHGLGGHAAELAELVRNLHCERPVYASQLPGLGGDAVLDRIEDMAQRLIGPIREAEPRGPYLLAGYSLGGLVAFDLACRLEAAGQETRLLLLDTHPDPRFWPMTAWLGDLADRAVLQWRRPGARSPARLAAEAGRMAGSFIDHLRARRGLGPISRAPSWPSDNPALQRVRAGMVTAKERYRPCYYPRAVTFVQPERRQAVAPANPAAAWRDYVDRLAVWRTPGDHLSMAMEQAPATAALLDRWIAEQAA